jgi:Uma2 family endonuclease
MAAKTPISLEKFLELPEAGPDGSHFELDEGELICVSPGGGKHSTVVSLINVYLSSILPPSRFTIQTGEAGYQLNDNTVRGIDVSVLDVPLSLDDTTEGFETRKPVLAVEVVSLKHDAQDLERKTRQYLDAGVKEVWVVYLATRTTYVHAADSRMIAMYGTGERFSSAALGHEIDTSNFFSRR